MIFYEKGCDLKRNKRGLKGHTCTHTASVPAICMTPVLGSVKFAVEFGFQANLSRLSVGSYSQLFCMFSFLYD